MSVPARDRPHETVYRGGGCYGIDAETALRMVGSQGTSYGDNLLWVADICRRCKHRKPIVLQQFRLLAANEGASWHFGDVGSSSAHCHVISILCSTVGKG